MTSLKMCSRGGLQAMIDDRQLAAKLAIGLRDENEDIRKQTWEVLCALVMFSHEGLDAAKQVLTANKGGGGGSDVTEWVEGVVRVLGSSDGGESKAVTLALLNCVTLRTDSLTERLALRNRLNDLARSKDIVASLREAAKQCSPLDIQVRVYDELKVKDERSLLVSEPNNHHKLFDSILKQVQGTGQERQLLTILQHLSQLGRIQGEVGHVGGWRAVEKAAVEWEEREENQVTGAPVTSDTLNSQTNGTHAVNGGKLPDLVTTSDNRLLPSPTCLTRLVPWHVADVQDSEVTGDKCVWRAACQLPATIDWTELERCFPLTGPCLPASDASLRTRDRYSKEELRPVLDGEREVKLGLLLHQYREPLTELLVPLKRGDCAKLTPDTLRALQRIVPPPAEGELLRNALRDVKSRLPQTDVFFLDLLEISGYHIKIEIMLAITEAKDMLRNLQQAIGRVIHTAIDIQSSSRLATVLGVMLAAGNFLNSSSTDPQVSHQATGFRLSSLAAFARVHSCTADMTLLQWVAKEAEKIDSSMPELSRDFKYLRQVAQSSASKITDDWTAAANQIQAASDRLPDTDRMFQAKLQSFIEEVQGEMSKCEQLLGRAEEERGKLAAYLSEDAATFDLTECAQHLATFLRLYTHATAVNHLQLLRSNGVSHTQGDGEDLMTSLLTDVYGGFPGRVLPVIDLDPAATVTNALMPDEELFQYILRKSALETKQAAVSRKSSAAPRHLVADLDMNVVEPYTPTDHAYSTDQQTEQAVSSRQRSSVGVHSSSRDSGSRRYESSYPSNNNDEDSSYGVPSYRSKYQRSTSEGSTVMASRLGMLGLSSQPGESRDWYRPQPESYRSQTSAYSSSVVPAGVFTTSRDTDQDSDTVRGPWGRRREALAREQAAESKPSSLSGRTEVKPRRRIARGQTEGDTMLGARAADQTTEAAERAREWLVAEQNGALPSQAGGRDSSMFFRSSRRRTLSSDLGQARPGGAQLTVFDTGDNFNMDSRLAAREAPRGTDYTPTYTRYSSSSDYAADLASRFPLAYGNRASTIDNNGYSFHSGQLESDDGHLAHEDHQLTGDADTHQLTDDIGVEQQHVDTNNGEVHSYPDTVDTVVWSTPAVHPDNANINVQSSLPADTGNDISARVDSVVPDAGVTPEETGTGDTLLSRSSSFRQKIAPRAARQRVGSRNTTDGEMDSQPTVSRDVTTGTSSAAKSQTHANGTSHSNGSDVISPTTAAAKQASVTQQDSVQLTQSRTSIKADPVDTSRDTQPLTSSRQKATAESRISAGDESEQRARLARSTHLQPVDMLTGTVPAAAAPSGRLSGQRDKVSPRPSPSSLTPSPTSQAGRTTPVARSTPASASSIASTRTTRPLPASSAKPTPTSSTEVLSTSSSRRSSGPSAKSAVVAKPSPGTSKTVVALSARSSRTSSRATSPAAGTPSNLSSTTDLRHTKASSEQAAGRSARVTPTKAPVSSRPTNPSTSRAATVTTRPGRI